MSVVKRTRRRIGREARRDRIVDAATEVFAEVGYDRASFGEIARRAGITRPVVYDHFPTKRDLHLYLLERESRRILEHVSRRLRGAGDAAARVATAIDAFFAYVEEHRYAWRMLFRETGGDPEAADAQRRIQHEAHLAVARLVAERGGAVAGETPDRIEMFAAAWGPAVNGLARWWYDRPDVPRAELVAVAMDALWVGLERLERGERWRRE